MQQRSATSAKHSLLARALVGLAIVASLTVVGHSGAQASTAVRRTIDVFGDSLSWQSSSYLKRDFSKSTAVNESHVFPGTSLCDWLPAIEKLTSKDAPTVAVLEFIGNVSTCDDSVTTPSALAAAYKADLTTAITALMADDVRDVVVDEGPRTNCTGYAYCAAQPVLHSAFLQVVSAFDSPKVVYAGLADRSVELGGKFTWRLTCLSAEVAAKLCARGSRIKVRSADGIHFCPVPDEVDGAMTPCPVYASGAYRFATGFAKTIWELDPATAPSTARTTP